MLTRAAFWGLVALDVFGILLLFTLGLAAAGSSRTSPVSVALFLLVIPGAVLAVAVVLFLRAPSPLVRALAFLLAAAPLAIAVSARALAEMQLRANTNEAGELTFFRAGPMREIAEAIARNDTATVGTLLPQVDVNRAGFSGTTLLISAMRQLRKTPREHGVLRLLLQAGADPNVGADYEFPLSIALQVSDRSGVEPVQLLLDAGADPNLVDSFGTPVYFTATGRSSGVDVLTMLLDRGADINALTREGQTALFSAAATRNWPEVLLLLERGADWRQGRSAMGRSFTDMVDGYAGAESSDSGYVAVVRFLSRQ